MLEILVTSMVLIIAVFALRRLTKGKISMAFRYALWLPVAFRLLFPVSLGTSPFSVLNLLPEVFGEAAESLQSGSLDEGDKAQPAAFEEGTWKMERISTQAGQPAGLSEAASQEKPAGKGEASFLQTTEGKGESRDRETAPAVSGEGFLFTGLLLRIVWLLGAVTVGGRLLLSQIRFARYLHRNRREISMDLLSGEWKKRLKKRGMKVYQVAGLPSPCLAGGQIYIGEGGFTGEAALSHILAHEYCHALHLDGFWAFLRCLLTAVYWFDPFVWAAAFAARQDSELACDEAAVRLLGESQRFAYGKTLLSLLMDSGKKPGIPGTSPMLEGGECSVRERVTLLTKRVETKTPVMVLVCLAVCLLCGCAFTGAQQGDFGTEDASAERAADSENQEEQAAAAADGIQKESGDERQMLTEEPNDTFGQIQSEYESAMEGAEQKAFEEVLNYHGVMEGKDDSELFLNREADYQAYYEFLQGEGENPMENGWYLLCDNEEAKISLYGLYTEAFGFRGLKTLIGGDVNTYDFKWCSSPVNPDTGNIRVLEWAQDGLPRRFVWKMLAEESSTVEIWRLYSGFRYDTGTVEVKTLSEKDCLSWAEQHLSFALDRETNLIHVSYDGNRDLGAIDISEYKDWKVEAVQLIPDAIGFSLEDTESAEGSDAENEGLAVHLVVGLSLEGVEGLWSDNLSSLTVQLKEDADSASGFALQEPRIDGHLVSRVPAQRKRLMELQTAGQGE